MFFNLLAGEAYCQVGINTENPQAALDINGDMIVKETPLMLNGIVLARDTISGKIGTLANLPGNSMFAQSREGQAIDLTKMNNGEIIPVTWLASDIVHNNLCTKTETDDYSFTFNQDALAEVSGFVNYQTTNPSPRGNYDQINTVDKYVAMAAAIIQYKQKDGTQWESISSATQFWPGNEGYRVIKTVNIPPVLRSFKEGDQIRIVVIRPNHTTGLNHGGAFGGENDKNIAVPYGGQFSKAIKVVAFN